MLVIWNKKWLLIIDVFLVYEVLETLNHISSLQSIPSPGFDSVVEIQVCHFVDQQLQKNAGSILWSLWILMSFIAKKFDDTSCHITAYLAPVFILPEAEYAWLNYIWGLARMELYLSSPKIWLLNFLHKATFSFQKWSQKYFPSAYPYCI